VHLGRSTTLLAMIPGRRDSAQKKAKRTLEQLQKSDASAAVTGNAPSQQWVRIIPVALIMYTIAFIDRTNISHCPVAHRPGPAFGSATGRNRCRNLLLGLSRAANPRWSSGEALERQEIRQYPASYSDGAFLQWVVGSRGPITNSCCFVCFSE
jgi:hypothetical protein